MRIDPEWYPIIITGLALAPFVVYEAYNAFKSKKYETTTTTTPDKKPRRFDFDDSYTLKK